MSDILDTIAKALNSPPGQIAAGGVLASIVWKFFERVEAVLPDHTKYEIAVWLVGVQTSKRVERWPTTFANIFDRVFGSKHFSWRCLWRSCAASFALFLIGTCLTKGMLRLELVSRLLIVAIWGNFLPDYVSLLESRYVMNLMVRSRNWVIFILLLVDAYITFLVAIEAHALADVCVWAYNGDPLYKTFLSPSYWGRVLTTIYRMKTLFIPDVTIHWFSRRYNGTASMWLYPAFFTSMWLWLYAGSGFLLKAARRFDIGFDWFNRKFDIEKKPLSSIGLIAGTLVAVMWWALVVIHHFV